MDQYIATPANKPVLYDAQESGDFHFYTLKETPANVMVFQLNLNHTDPVKNALYNNRDFRVALSHAIDRQSMIEAVFVGQGAQRGLSLLSSLIMTRLLAPEAFGLMAMVFTVHMLVNMISDIGIRQSIVRAKKGDDIAFLQVAWTVQVMRAALVALVVLAAAGGLMLLGPRLAAPESVYADPLLPGLVAASALIVLFRGLESVGVHLASRRMKQRRVKPASRRSGRSGRQREGED